MLARTATNAAMKPSASSVRAPAMGMRVSVPRRAPRVQRALLLPREDSQLQQRLQQNRPMENPVEAVVKLVRSWLEPQQSNEHDGMPDYMLDHEEGGHSGWGHSHIAERLATEGSVSLSSVSDV